MAGDASWAFALPNNNVAPGQALETAISRKQQMDLQEMEANERRKAAQLKQQQDNSAANMAALNKRTDDILKGQTLSSFVNNRTSDEVDKLYSELSRLAGSGLSPDKYQPLMANKLLEISKQHSYAMTASEQIVEQAKVLAGGTSNLDQEAVLNIGANSLAKNLFNPDGSMKNPDLLSNDINHFTDLKDENLRGLVTKSSEAFYDFFKKHPQSDISDKEFSSNKGYSELDKWKGKALGDFTEPEFDDKGKALKMTIKSETIPGMKDGEGKPLKILPETLYKQLQADDQVGNAMAKMWTENSMKERFNWMVANGKTKTTPQDEELIKKNFYLKQANTAIPSAIQREEANVIPRPRVSNNFFFGGAKPFDAATTLLEIDRVGELDDISLASGAKISKGQAVDAQGNPYEGLTNIPKGKLPAGLLTIIKPMMGEKDLKKSSYDLDIRNGRIEAIRPSGGAWITRQELYNLQLQNNTEPQKGSQKVYGPVQKPAPKSTPSKKTDPLGIL